MSQRQDARKVAVFHAPASSVKAKNPSYGLLNSTCFRSCRLTNNIFLFYHLSWCSYRLTLTISKFVGLSILVRTSPLEADETGPDSDCCCLKESQPLHWSSEGWQKLRNYKRTLLHVLTVLSKCFWPNPTALDDRSDSLSFKNTLSSLDATI